MHTMLAVTADVRPSFGIVLKRFATELLQVWCLGVSSLASSGPPRATTASDGLLDGHVSGVAAAARNPTISTAIPARDGTQGFVKDMRAALIGVARISPSKITAASWKNRGALSACVC